MKLLIPLTIVFIFSIFCSCKNTKNTKSSEMVAQTIFTPKTPLEYYNLLPTSPYFDNEVEEVSTEAQRAQGITVNNTDQNYIVGGSKTGPKFTMKIYSGFDKEYALVNRYEAPGSMFPSFMKQLEYKNGKFVEVESSMTKFYENTVKNLPDTSDVLVSIIAQDEIIFLDINPMDDSDNQVRGEIAKFKWNGKAFIETQNRM